MKKIFAALFLLISMAAYAQTDNFVVNRYDPPILAPNPDHTTPTNIDVDGDGKADYRFHPILVRYRFYTYFFGLNNSDGDSCSFSYIPLEAFGTLNTAEISEWYGTFRNDCEVEPQTLLLALRKKHNNDYYYGWTYIDVNKKIAGDNTAYDLSLELSFTAMCTLPNQHITIGQTSISANPLDNNTTDEEPNGISTADENGKIVFRSLGGSQFDKIVISNCLGQVILHTQGVNNPVFTLDKSNTPSGIYVMQYSLKNGHNGFCKFYVR